jgi:hypothetical protein
MLDSSGSAPGIACCVDVGVGVGLNAWDRVGDADGGELELPLQPPMRATTALQTNARVVEERIAVTMSHQPEDGSGVPQQVHCG